MLKKSHQLICCRCWSFFCLHSWRELWSSTFVRSPKSDLVDTRETKI